MRFGLALLIRSQPDRERSTFGASPAGRHLSSDHLRVLVADDNRDAAETLARVLRTWGHEVLVAYDGPSALEVARYFEPHVALLDIRMPGMHGGDVAVNIRREDLLCGTSIVVTSACEPDDIRLARYEDVFDGHLGEPCDIEELGRLLAPGRGPLPAAESVQGVR